MMHHMDKKNSSRASAVIGLKARNLRYKFKNTRSVATKQGASGNQRKNPQNCFRALKHVFGVPQRAPDFSWRWQSVPLIFDAPRILLTLRPHWKRSSTFLAWSMNILLSDITTLIAKEPRGGQTLTSGWRGALCQVRGDWAFYSGLFQIPTVEFEYSSVLALGRWSQVACLAYLTAARVFAPPWLASVTGLRLDCDVLHYSQRHVDNGSHSEPFQKQNPRRKSAELDSNVQSRYNRTKTTSKFQGKLYPAQAGRGPC